jgi:hypothetical protein
LFYLFQKRGKFLVQKRSKFKEYCPSYLDLVIGGVVSTGEDDMLKVKKKFKKRKTIQNFVFYI